MSGRIAAPVVAATLRAPASEAPALRATRPGGAASAIVPLRGGHTPEAIPGSAASRGGYEPPVALDAAGRLDRNRERGGRPARPALARPAPGDAVLAARGAGAARGAPSRAGATPERVTPPGADARPVPPPWGPHRAEVAACSMAQAQNTRRCPTR